MKLYSLRTGLAIIVQNAQNGEESVRCIPVQMAEDKGRCEATFTLSALRDEAPDPHVLDILRDWRHAIAEHDSPVTLVPDHTPELSARQVIQLEALATAAGIQIQREVLALRWQPAAPRAVRILDQVLAQSSEDANSLALQAG